MARDMDDEIYISVPLDDHLDLMELKEFFLIMKDYGIEDWEHFESALADFLEEDPDRDDPREIF